MSNSKAVEKLFQMPTNKEVLENMLGIDGSSISTPIVYNFWSLIED